MLSAGEAMMIAFIVLRGLFSECGDLKTRNINVCCAPRTRRHRNSPRHFKIKDEKLNYNSFPFTEPQRRRESVCTFYSSTVAVSTRWFSEEESQVKALICIHHLCTKQIYHWSLLPNENASFLVNFADINRWGSSDHS